MKYLISSMLAILGIVDFLFFVHYFEAPGWTSVFWQAHIIISLLSILLVRLIPNRYKIYPYFLFMIMPGFGPFAFGFAQFSVIYFEYNQTLLFEYEKYIYFEKILDLESQSSSSSDVKTMSIQDQFLYSQHDTKKDMISSMLSGQDSDYSYLLKDSLDDEDFEVTHYAATALNAFENEFEEKISQTRDTYISKGSPQSLVAYMNAIEDYLDSKLMDPAVEQIIREDYVKLLYKHLDIEPDSRETYSKIIKSLSLLRKEDDLLNALRIYLRLYPKDPDGHLMVMSYLFRKHKRDKLAAYAETLTKNYETLPDELDQYVRFWVKEGGVS